jgi:hypothetical protein
MEVIDRCLRALEAKNSTSRHTDVLLLHGFSFLGQGGFKGFERQKPDEHLLS